MPAWSDLTASDDSIWVTSVSSNAIVVVDPVTQTVADTIAVGERPTRALFAFDRIWVPNRADTGSTGEASISVIDAASKAIVATIPVPDEPRTPVAFADLVWVPHAEELTVIDPMSLEVIDSIAVRPGWGPVGANSLLWTSDGRDQQVSIVDPESRSVVETICCTDAETLHVVGDRVWAGSDGDIAVIDPLSRTVTQVDGDPALAEPDVDADPALVFGSGHFVNDYVTLARTDTDEVIARIELGDRPETESPRETPLVAYDHVWIASSGDFERVDHGAITVVDPRDGEVVARIDVSEDPRSALAAFGLVWVPARGAIDVIDPELVR